MMTSQVLVCLVFLQLYSLHSFVCVPYHMYDVCTINCLVCVIKLCSLTHSLTCSFLLLLFIYFSGEPASVCVFNVILVLYSASGIQLISTHKQILIMFTVVYEFT